MLVGIVGKPSAGKSTFFRAATLAEAEVASYPFTTIKPNHGVGFVKVKCVDKGFGKKCKPRVGYCLDGWRFVPIDMLDVAGLVPGAHEGKGMGNQFLDDLRQADVLVHVIDVSGSINEKGEQVEPLSYDPAEDIRFLEEEIDMWYLGLIKKNWARFARQVIQEKQEIEKALAKQFSGLKITEDMIKEAIKGLELDKERPDKWSEEDLRDLAANFRKKTKPMIVACNKIDIPGAEKNFKKLKKEFPDHILIPCSAESELALKEAAKKELIKYIPGEKDFELVGDAKLSAKQKKALEFIKEKVVLKFGTGVQDVLDKAVFDLLDHIAVFPVENATQLSDQKGNILPDCLLLPKSSTALELAYAVHTDIGDKFIRAVDVKTKRTVGKEHKLKHRDVIEIVTSK